MPTGYTSQIGDGQTFKDFVWTCARAFGALATMRDDPMDAKIPDAFPHSDHHNKGLATARARLAELQRVEPVDSVRMAFDDYQKQWVEWKRRATESDKLRAQYAAMIQRVEAWAPPSTDHEGLRKFMIEQLRQSMVFDCYDVKEPQGQSGDSWLKEEIRKAEWSIDYHQKEGEKKEERTEARNTWLRLLRESVPPETAVVTQEV